MKRLFIANWKMNPVNAEGARALFDGIRRSTESAKSADVFAAVPFPFISFFAASRRPVVGAQNVFWEKSGPYTGEVSPAMLRSVGARFAIVGHSERRVHLGETDVMINQKVKAALAAGLRVVLCVGERDRNDENFQHVVRSQLLADLAGIPKNKARQLVVAYEPVWAIGTGKTVTSGDLFEMATYIRRMLLDSFGKAASVSIPILYGGSVNAKNAREFLAVNGVGGLLVGGASLDADEFAAIVKSI